MGALPALSSKSFHVRFAPRLHTYSRDPLIHVHAVSVEPETRLRALRWYISRALEESTRVLRDSSFLVRRTPDSLVGDSIVPCRMHTAIEDIAQALVCDLVLVLA